MLVCVVVQLAVVCSVPQEMHTRNETLLQMYGEKSEQAEELRLDLIDVKEMYRQQVRAQQGCVTYTAIDSKCFLSHCRFKTYCSRKEQYHTSYD